MPPTDTSTPEHTTEALPPYSGEDAVCAMCSHPEAFTYYRPATGTRGATEFNGRPRLGRLPERLERACMRCDYQWDEALQPAPPALRPAAIDEIAYALERSHSGWALDLSPECAAHMAGQLIDVLHLMVRVDHPMWQPRPAPRLLVPPPVAEQAHRPDLGLTASVPIVLHDEPPAPAGQSGFAPGFQQ